MWPVFFSEAFTATLSFWTTSLLPRSKILSIVREYLLKLNHLIEFTIQKALCVVLVISYLAYWSLHRSHPSPLSSSPMFRFFRNHMCFYVVFVSVICYCNIFDRCTSIRWTCATCILLFFVTLRNFGKNYNSFTTSYPSCLKVLLSPPHQQRAPKLSLKIGTPSPQKDVQLRINLGSRPLSAYKHLCH